MINLSSYQRNCATAKFYKFVQAVQEQRADEWTVEKKKAMFDECESDIGKLLNPTLASFYKSDLFKKVVAKNGKKYRKKMNGQWRRKRLCSMSARVILVNFSTQPSPHFTNRICLRRWWLKMGRNIVKR